MRVITVVGARPQFIKLAPLSIELKKRDIEEIVIHSGQHYDYKMSEQFLEELLINKPKYNLNVGSGSHAMQTSKMLVPFEELFLKLNPEIIFVFGDTNTTLAASLAASKINIPVAHIESGLRSFNRKMPEEINRILTDHISNWCLAPTKTALCNLFNENLKNVSFLVGDIMLDSLLLFKQKANFEQIAKKYNIEKNKYYLATIHRAENTDNIERIKNILIAFSKLNDKIVFPLHPRSLNIINQNSLWSLIGENVNIIEPCSYIELLGLLENSKYVMTDSGGVQKESYLLKVPCITLREETEWLETVDLGCNVIVNPNFPFNITDIVNNNFMNKKFENIFGDGNASGNICDRVFGNEYLKNN